MRLDEQTCYRALASRDARFDGRFFAGVRTTGIYCRPVCPARKPLRRNVEYFPSAAAAEAAGFRACQRCRPDAAPGSPEWSARSALIARALRLIHQGAPGEDGVEGLASRLGVSARHLGRLFREELGASPLAVAQTVRAHLARRLLDETDLALGEVAFAAGYRSVRRFNAELRARFASSPGELRRARRRVERPAGAPLVLRLPFRSPLDWTGLLAFHGARAIAGLERVDGEAYRRTVVHEGRAGHVEVRPAPSRDALLFSTDLPAGRGLAGLVERARRLFDLRADPAALAADLAGDPVLGPRLARVPGVRVPGAWDGFELAVRAVVGQQVSVRGARTVLGRLVARLGAPMDSAGPGLARLFPTPEALAGADPEALPMPRARGRALIALAETVVAGELDLDAAADADETRRRLLALPGIGPWTAEYVALRALCDPDAFPAGDLVLRRRLSAEGATIDARALERRAEPWRPWRAYAALLLWREPARGAQRAAAGTEVIS